MPTIAGAHWNGWSQRKYGRRVELLEAVGVGGFDARGHIDIGAVPTALEIFRKAGMNAHAQAQGAAWGIDGGGGEMFLDVDRAANDLDRIFEGEVKSVAHIADFVAAVRLAAGPDEMEVAALDALEAGVIALAIVAAERNVAFRGTGLDDIGEKNG
jgi:hypothetical protein